MKKRDLFTLVHSLSPSEKKFFREYAGRSAHAETNYLRIFDAVAAQTQFDDDFLKQQFQNEKFITNFHVAKSYLFELILESLAHMDIHRSNITRYRSLMNEALLLFNKNLFELALDRSEKAGEICNRMDWPLLKMENILLRLRILNRKDLVYAGKYFTEVCYPEMKQLNESVSQQLEIKFLHKKISYAANASGRFRTRAEEEIVNGLMEHELLLNPDQLESFDTILAYYSIMAYFYWLKNDFPNAFEFEEKKWILFNNFPERIRENVQDSATILYNLCQISYARFWDEKAERFLKSLENLPTLTREDRIFVRNKYVRAGFVQLRMADKAKQPVLTTRLESLLIELKPLLPNLEKTERFRSLYETVVVLMRFEKYSEAIDYIQVFVQEDDVEDLRPIHYPFVRIFNLICQFELGHYDILLNLINNASYALKKKNKLYRIEQLFLKFFKKLVVAPDRLSRKLLIQEMSKDLKSMGEDPFEKTGLEFLKHVLWFEKYE